MFLPVTGERLFHAHACNFYRRFRHLYRVDPLRERHICRRRDWAHKQCVSRHHGIATAGQRNCFDHLPDGVLCVHGRQCVISQVAINCAGCQAELIRRQLPQIYVGMVPLHRCRTQHICRLHGVVTGKCGDAVHGFYFIDLEAAHIHHAFNAVNGDSRFQMRCCPLV